jgi:hypothetical protein
VPAYVAAAGLVRHSCSFPASIVLPRLSVCAISGPARTLIASHPAQAIVRLAAASDDSAGEYFHYKYVVLPTRLG